MAMRFCILGSGSSGNAALLATEGTRVLIEGPGIPIVDVHLSILKRVMLDDLITIATSVGGIGTTSFRSRHTFSREGEVVAQGELVHVCVERETRETVPVPQWIRDVATPE